MVSARASMALKGLAKSLIPARQQYEHEKKIIEGVGFGENDISIY